MPVRHGLLAVGAVLVLGLGIYLFFEVRAKPAAARVASGARGVVAERERASDSEDRAAQASGGGGGDSGGEGAEGRRKLGAILREPPRGPDGEATPVSPAKLDATMNEANKAYDRGDMDDAKEIARKVLASSPGNVRMLRIVVSANCIAGDPAEAQTAFNQLPPFDREQMKTRCARYGVSFSDP